MDAPIRKIVTVCEDVLREHGRATQGVLRKAAVAAVVANPWLDRDFVEDLQPAAQQLAPLLAVELSTKLTEALGGVDQVEAFGKAAIVGLDGEIEHGSALIHTPHFGNLFRELVEGTAIIVFSDDRLPAGTPLTVPMWHKTHAATRSHYQTIAVRIPDAPRPDEIVIIAAASTGGRPHPRIGDRRTDAAVTLADHRHVLDKELIQ